MKIARNKVQADVAIKHRLNTAMEQHTLRKRNNYLNPNIYFYLETSGGQSSDLYLNVVHFLNTSVK
jgi:hypothetical protein